MVDPAKLKAGKDLTTRHLCAINALVKGIMTTDLGLVCDDKITPDLKYALDGFLSVRCSMNT
jgi:hypothetical protein